MSNPEFSDLLDIVASLKDQVCQLEEQLQATRDQVALLTEAMDQRTPQPVTSRSCGPWR